MPVIRYPEGVWPTMATEAAYSGMWIWLRMTGENGAPSIFTRFLIGDCRALNQHDCAPIDGLESSQMGHMSRQLALGSDEQLGRSQLSSAILFH
jgi:hypothetical protein